MIPNWRYSPETPNLGQNQPFLEPFDLAIWRMTLKNNRAPLLCYFKLYASFHSHWRIQAGVTVRKGPIWVKIIDFFKPCDLTIWRMTLKNNRAPLLCYFKLCASFRSHRWFDFKLELQSGNAQFGSNLTIFRAAWPWNLTVDLQKQ